MKKTVVLLLALLVCFSLAVSVFADDDLVIAPNPNSTEDVDIVIAPSNEERDPIVSPEDNPIEGDDEGDEEGGGDDSPQTGIDNNVTLIWTIGIAAVVVLGVSTFTAVKAKSRS